MKQIKYLNALLTVISICLVFITAAVTGIIPTAKANDTPVQNNKPYVMLPVGEDGTLNVKIINDELDLNIQRVGGNYVYGKLPIKIEK